MKLMVRVLGNLDFRDIVIKEDSGTIIRWVISVYVSCNENVYMLRVRVYGTLNPKDIDMKMR
ncbi:hypothetical protein Sjap_018173 [Stephania japonica]|uniref:Uncharacterized protein n=1 Tax=Stephania japonica TaxID=461633 RepID=A0AAP0I7H4_9MAGN